MLASRLTTAVLLLLLGARGVVAQEGAVSFAFEGTSLEVQLRTNGAPGQVEVIDGNVASVSVVDFTGAAGASYELKGSVLSVQHGSAVPGDYQIVVPSGAGVSLTVDGRLIAALAPNSGERRLEWSWPGLGGGVSSSTIFRMPTSGARSVRKRLTVNAYFGDLVADSVDLAYTPRIKMFKIVVGGSEFRVTGDRSVDFRYHEGSRWGVITPRADQATITVELPTRVRSFKVRVDGTTIWEYDIGRGRSHCDPVAEIIQRDGRNSWVFTPDNGRLECTISRGPRPA